MKKVGILGRGTMALGIVQIFAQNEFEVLIWVRSIDEENPRASVASIENFHYFGNIIFSRGNNFYIRFIKI